MSEKGKLSKALLYAPERIRKAAQSCQLDTVFFLKGKEAATC